MKITHAYLDALNPCNEGKKAFYEAFPPADYPDGVEYQRVLDKAVENGHLYYATWLLNNVGPSEDTLVLESINDPDKAIVFAGNIIVDGDIRCRHIETGGFIKAGNSINARWVVKSGKFIKAGGCIEAGNFIKANGYIEAGGFIKAYGYIRAGKHIYAGHFTMADNFIEAARCIEADASIKADMSIVAGQFIIASRDIKAGMDIKAVGFITTNGDITAGGRIEVDGYVKAGLGHEIYAATEIIATRKPNNIVHGSFKEAPTP